MAVDLWEGRAVRILGCHALHHPTERLTGRGRTEAWRVEAHRAVVTQGDLDEGVGHGEALDRREREVVIEPARNCEVDVKEPVALVIDAFPARLAAQPLCEFFRRI